MTSRLDGYFDAVVHFDRRHPLTVDHDVVLAATHLSSDALMCHLQGCRYLVTSFISEGLSRTSTPQPPGSRPIATANQAHCAAGPADWATGGERSRPFCLWTTWDSMDPNRKTARSARVGQFDQRVTHRFHLGQLRRCDSGTVRGVEGHGDSLCGRLVDIDLGVPVGGRGEGSLA